MGAGKSSSLLQRLTLSLNHLKEWRSNPRKGGKNDEQKKKHQKDRGEIDKRWQRHC